MSVYFLRAAEVRPARGKPRALAARRKHVLDSLTPAARAQLLQLRAGDLLVVEPDVPDLSWELLALSSTLRNFDFAVARARLPTREVAAAAAYNPPPSKMVVTVDARGDLYDSTSDLLTRARALADHNLIDLHAAKLSDVALRILRWNPRMVAILTHGDDDAIRLQDADAIAPLRLHAALLPAMASSELRLVFLGACYSARRIGPELVDAGLPWAIAFGNAPYSHPVAAGMEALVAHFGKLEIPELLGQVRQAIADRELQLGAAEPATALGMRVFVRSDQACHPQSTPSPAAPPVCDHATSDWLRQFLGRDPVPETGLAIVASCPACQSRLLSLRESYSAGARETLRALLDAAPDLQRRDAERALESGLTWDTAVAHLLETGLMVRPRGWIAGPAWPLLFPGPGLRGVDGFIGSMFTDDPVEGELTNEQGEVTQLTFARLAAHRLAPGRYSVAAWGTKMGSWNWTLEVVDAPRPDDAETALISGYLDDAIVARISDPDRWLTAHAALLERQRLTASTCIKLSNATGATVEWLEAEMLLRGRASSVTRP